MSRDRIIAGIGEILETSVAPETDLTSCETWDSMTVVLIVALIDDVTGHSVDGEKIATCTTVADVLALANV